MFGSVLLSHIAFLLENANAVIQYRLRKEILRDLTKTDEEKLLEQIYQTPTLRSYRATSSRTDILEAAVIAGQTGVVLLTFITIPLVTGVNLRNDMACSIIF